MAERLTTLLNAEAQGIDVPPARPELIIRSARRMRLRRRAVRGVAGIAAVTIVATGVGLFADHGKPAAAQARFEQAAAAPAYGTYGAFAAGSTVYIGNHRVKFDEKIKSLYYTSEGILVRMGKRAYLDDNGPSHYTLIRPDGSSTTIDLRMGDRVPATDPKSPNVAYLEPTGKRWSFVVVDLRTGDEVARKAVDGKFTWGGWEAPPATMAGDRVWGLFDEGWREFNWRTGQARLVPGTANAILEAAHGRWAQTEDGTKQGKVVDLATGAVVRTFTPDVDEDGLTMGATLSPEGRYLRLDSSYSTYDENNKLIDPAGPSRFLDLDTGHQVAIPDEQQYGWTPTGNALSVDPAKDQITVCDPSDGSCDRIDLEIGSGAIKLGGAMYES